MTVDADQLVRLLLLGLWGPLGCLAVFYFIFQFFKRRLDLISSRESIFYNDRRAMEVDEIRVQVRHLTEILERQSSFNEKYFQTVEERTRELFFRSNRDLVKMVQSMRDGIKTEIQKNFKTHNIISNTNEKSDESRQNLIRELSHALYTPLSRIDAIALNVTAAKPDPAIVEKMAKAKSAVEICYAYLTAYRNVINISEKSPYWAPQSLRDAIRASSDVFIDAQNKSIGLEIDAPDSVRSVSNIYILALLLPLIENAIEASDPEDLIRISIVDSPGNIRAQVANTFRGEFPSDQALVSGFTTKAGSQKLLGSKKHEGLGLTIVQNLLSSVSGASLTFKVEGSIVVFTIMLPGRGPE